MISQKTQMKEAHGPRQIEIITSQDLVTPSIKLAGLRNGSKSAIVLTGFIFWKKQHRHSRKHQNTRTYAEDIDIRAVKIK